MQANAFKLAQIRTHTLEPCLFQLTAPDHILLSGRGREKAHYHDTEGFLLVFHRERYEDKLLRRVNAPLTSPLHMQGVSP